MNCLIAFDGLSELDIPILQRCMPAFAELCLRSDCVQLESAVLSAPQAVWSEILTGSPWHVNGCVGYSRPQLSLAKMKVISEKDLNVPTKLSEKNGGVNTFVNVPVVTPKPNRIWLSDGSLPLSKIVSPSRFRSAQPFSDYNPRPLVNFGAYQVSANKIVEKCIEIENKRLECVASLLHQSETHNFIYRIGLFDYLTHILGLNYLSAESLHSFSVVSKFLEQLNLFFEEICKMRDIRLSVISGYRHVPGRAVMNLNMMLQSAGILHITESSEKQERRAKAFTLASGITPNVRLLDDMEGQVDTATTKAVSPVAGSIFINRKSIFDDGCVDEENYEKFLLELTRYVRNRLLSMFGLGVVVAERLQDSKGLKTAVPELLVHVDGVEFHNMNDQSATMYNVPRTVHAPGGFAICPKGLYSGERVTLVDLNRLLND